MNKRTKFYIILKLFLSVSLVPAKTCAKFFVYSFIRSKDITPNRMHVFLPAKCLKCTQKSCFWGFMVGKFGTLMLRPPRKSVPSETRHLVQKNDGDMSLHLFSRAWQEITKNEKIHYISPLFQGSLLGRLL